MRNCTTNEMDDILDAKIETILSIGEGVKALLFDEDTKTILSNLIPHSRFLENDYFLFDSILNKNRDKIAGVTCVVVIRPENIKFLIEEISEPFYERYIVLFTNQVDPVMIEILATSDTRCVVCEIHEIYMDFFKQDEFLYTLFRSGTEDLSLLHRKRRIVDGLFAFILSLGKIPTITVQSFDKSLFEDCEILNNKLSQLNICQGGTLIVLDRMFDLYTPLLYEWRYQSLLREHTDYENGLAKVGGRCYSMTRDSFFNVSKFKDVYEVSEDIKALVKKADVKRGKLHNVVFGDLEESTRISHQIETHLTLHNHVMKECLRRKELSEIEMKILCDEKVRRTEVDEYLLRRDIPVIERCKLFIIYSLKNSNNLSDEVKNYPDLIESVKRFEMKYLQTSRRERFYGYRFDSDIDVKLGYQPPIGRILHHWWTDKMREKHFSTVRDSENKKDVVVIYVRNGLTYSEYRVVQEYYSSNMAEKSKLYIISDSMVSYKDIVG